MPVQISSEFWGIGGFIVGTIGILVSILVFFIGRKKTLLEYEILSTRLISEDMSNIQGLEIRLNSQPVKNLQSTTVKFINSGNQTITSSDFATRAPLKATVTDHFLGDENCYHILSDNPNCELLLKEIDNANYVIEFDFLKPGEAFEIVFLHSGTFSISGELKSGILRKQSPLNKRSLFISACLLIFSVLLFVLLKYFYPLSSNKYIESASIMSFTCITAAISNFITTLSYYRKHREK